MAGERAPDLVGLQAGLQATLRFRRRRAIRYSSALFLIVLATVCATIALAIWAVRHSDEQALHREAAALEQAIADEQRHLAEDLEDLVFSDEAYRNIDQDFSADWVLGRMAAPLSRDRGHDGLMILSRQGRPLLAYFDGAARVPGFYSAKIEPQLDAEIAEVREAYRKALEERRLEAISFAGRRAAIYRPAILRLDGQPTIASIMAVAPATNTRPLPVEYPSIAISLRRLDGETLASIGRHTQLAGLGLSADATAKLPHLTLRGAQASSLGALVWSRESSASRMLAMLAPAFILAVLIILATTAGLLMRAYRASEELAFSEARARQAALHDPLSGLPNRVYFDNFARQHLAPGRHAAGMLSALIYMDVDHFKEVNDTLGHPVGDQLIREVARRLRINVRSGDVVARISGDEFLILVCNRRDKEEIAQACRRLIGALNRNLTIDGHRLPTTVSMGVALYPEHGTDLTQLLRRADIALYQAKEQGRDRFVFFETAMDDALKVRRKIEEEMRAGLERDEFYLLYQPILTADGRRTVGVEALVRWNHPEHGDQLPAFFLPIAEGSDLMWALGTWVLRTAMRDALSWPDLLVSVNVSPTQLRHPDFVPFLRRTIRDLGFPRERLELEVTEAVLMDHTSAAKRIIGELKDLGVHLALDDFGTGYSSLSYLRQFHFDKFKIDRSFVTHVESEPESAAIICSLVGLGEALGMKITAEGIETPQQHRFLQAAGCDYLQGFHFGRPMTAQEIAARLESGARILPIALRA